MSAITPVTSMPANGASPSGMLTSALPQIRLQAITASGGSRLTLIQKNENGDWFRVPQERVKVGKSLKEAKATLVLATGEASEIAISNDFGSTAYHVLEENGGYSGSENGSVTATIAGATAPVTTGDLSSSNVAASGTLTVTGASTLTGAVSTGSTLAVTGAAILSSTLAVTGASTLTGQLSANGGVQVKGTAPSAAADAVMLGIVDINGAGSGSLKKIYEGGGTLTERVASASGALKELFYNESVADDATITLPVPTSGHTGILTIAALVNGGQVAIQNDGTCTKLSGTTDFVVADTDAKLAVYSDAGTPKIKNRLGSTVVITARYLYS